MKIKYLIFTLLLVLVTAIALFFNYGDQWAGKMLQKQLNTIDNLSCDSLQIDLVQNKVEFKQLKYRRDNIEIEVPSTVVQNINILKFLIQNVLQIDLLQLDSASFSYFPQEEQPKKSATKQSFKFKVNKIDLVHARFIAFRDSAIEPFISAHVDLTLKELVSDDLKKLSDMLNRIFDLKVNNINYKFTTGRYHLYAKSILYSEEDRSLLGQEIKLIPQYDKYEFAKVVGHEIDWINISIDSIFIKTKTISELINHKHISQLSIYQPEIIVFRDKRLPFPENHRPQILKEMLADKDISFGIDSISIVHGNISYQEHVSEAEQPGEVTFSNLDGQIVNLYSYNNKKNRKPHLTAECRLFDATMLYADVTFPNKPNDLTMVKGKLAPVQLSVFNQMLEHIAFARIKSGQLNSLDFEFSYDSTHSGGQMEFDYNDLQIEFFKEDRSLTGELYNDAKGFFANTFIMENKNNENSKGEIRIGKIDFERDRSKSMFNFWWKSILSGFKSSSGIKPPEKKTEEQ